jgi:hypothetical protein
MAAISFSAAAEIAEKCGPSADRSDERWRREVRFWLPGAQRLYVEKSVQTRLSPNSVDCFQRRSNARLLLLRRTHAALRSSNIRWIDISETNQVLAYVRPGKQIDDNVMVLLNYGAEPVGVMLPPDEFKSRTGILIDLLHGGDVVIG